MEDKNKVTFEESMKNLETIVTELEKGDLSLDDSVKKFEEGIKISKECNSILESAEKKISILLEKDGELTEESFVGE
ncbi:MAG: exodeoxyribonuclease VII small subunit [Clostridia bacterium]|nr:exodeoxyribonuclease VII small subunit [Clostridia bacterium]